MEYQCTESRFLADVADHAMDIKLEDENFRHLTFTKNGSNVYRFDLITWPGHLCISGDCGTYVFSRIADMFQFFRMDDRDFNFSRDRKLNINPGYWGEKLESIAKNVGYVEFDEDAFSARVKGYFDEHKDELSEEEASDLWEAIEDDVLSLTDNEHDAYQAAYNFSHNDFQFVDFFDGGGTERYTFRFIWCLYAIVWGIQKYDEAKEVKEAA